MPLPLSNYAVAIIVLTPQGVVVVRDPQKPTPNYWKFPGGRNLPGETPLQTAVRELQEETSLAVDPNTFQLLHDESRGSSEHPHHFFCFKTQLPTNPTLPNRALTGEDVAIVGLETIASRHDFFPNHKKIAERYLN